MTTQTTATLPKTKTKKTARPTHVWVWSPPLGAGWNLPVKRFYAADGMCQLGAYEGDDPRPGKYLRALWGAGDDGAPAPKLRMPSLGRSSEAVFTISWREEDAYAAETATYYAAAARRLRKHSRVELYCSEEHRVAYLAQQATAEAEKFAGDKAARAIEQLLRAELQRVYATAIEKALAQVAPMVRPTGDPRPISVAAATAYEALLRETLAKVEALAQQL